MNEVWKPIAGYEGYEVSNLGQVRSFYKGGRILKPQTAKNGYLFVILSRSGKHKNFRVHRLVALAFIDNPENKPEVNHVDTNKLNNCVENLAWATKSENMEHAVKEGLILRGEDCSWANLTNEQVLYIRNNPDNLSIGQLAEMFGVSKATISEIQRGDRYKNADGKIRNKIERRIPDEIRAEIRRLYVKGSRKFGSYALARRFKVDPSTIQRIVKEQLK